MHGRDHRPGGTDPIPGVGSGAAAMLFGNEVNISGSSTAVIGAGQTGVCLFSAFQAIGDLSVFATHDTVNYPGFANPLPKQSAFNNSSGDDWLFALGSGLVTFTFDVTFEAGPFPIAVSVGPGNSNNDGTDPLGPQGWYDSTSVPSFSWASSRPIANDDFLAGSPGFYTEMQFQIQNQDSSDHTLDSQNGFVVTALWEPIVPGSQVAYY